jgi:hypothetical protein
MRVTSTVFAMMVGLVLVTGCERAAEQGAATPAAAGHTHEHADGTTHADHDLEHDGDMDNDHDHGEEVALGTVTIGGMEVELAQAHGKVEAGEEGHLVVKLPYNDNGETVVRAWIGTEDRTTSLIGKGEYAPAHGDYDIHAMAPDPLPENVMWWIEIEQPDGTKVVGSAKPKLD